MTNMIGSVEPSSLRRSCSSGPLSPGIRTSRRMQPGTLSLGKRPTNAGPKHRSRPRNRRVSNDVPSLCGRTHRRRQCTRSPARIDFSPENSLRVSSNCNLSMFVLLVLSGWLTRSKGRGPKNGTPASIPARRRCKISGCALTAPGRRRMPPLALSALACRRDCAMPSLLPIRASGPWP